MILSEHGVKLTGYDNTDYGKQSKFAFAVHAVLEFADRDVTDSRPYLKQARFEICKAEAHFRGAEAGLNSAECGELRNTAGLASSRKSR
jgi:hypothetical protein